MADLMDDGEGQERMPMRGGMSGAASGDGKLMALLLVLKQKIGPDTLMRLLTQLASMPPPGQQPPPQGQPPQGVPPGMMGPPQGMPSSGPRGPMPGPAGLGALAG